MNVTDVLRSRMEEPSGLQRMAAISVLVHASMVALVIVGHGRLMPHRQDRPRSVMTITLGSGAPGPQSGGMTAMGGRAVQVETPEATREPVTPPAAKTPEMTVPLPGKAQIKSAPTPAVKQAPDVARSRAPSKGREAIAGSTVAETNVRGQGFGLSTSGGVGTGVRLDVSDFCCQGYLDVMSQRIRQQWDPIAEAPSQVTIVFTIQRDGTLGPATVEKSSGSAPLDIRAQRAILTTHQLPPLPAEFLNPTLTVHLTFQYIR